MQSDPQTANRGGLISIGYPCPYCDYFAKWPTELQKHIMVHSKERPHRCVICGLSYKWKWDLGRHFDKSHHKTMNPYKKNCLSPCAGRGTAKRDGHPRVTGPSMGGPRPRLGTHVRRPRGMNRRNTGIEFHPRSPAVSTCDAKIVTSLVRATSDLAGDSARIADVYGQKVTCQESQQQHQQAQTCQSSAAEMHLPKQECPDMLLEFSNLTRVL
ncbi:unnamed protein product [Echinostoma caproni]|uniref:C2H2-type domain-containing protein n=1 Tax=Echinostoma caproni TaxID=27848 RepID=A0A183BG76_9TREM|nr:unnamed protein product [Echinostoma caproni]